MPGQGNNVKKAIPVALVLAGCASIPKGDFTLHIASQPDDAPVKIVSITSSGNNLLAHVVIKNTTDRAVQVFDVSWAVIRPKNCGVNGNVPFAQAIMGEGHSVFAEARGEGTLPPGASWGARPLKPHEQIEITSLSLTRAKLAELAQTYNARRLRVQVWIGSANFQPAEGGPDWRNEQVRSDIPDTDDAAQQTCSLV